MAGKVTNTLIANITSEEQSTGNVDINRGTGNPAFGVDVGQFTTYKKIPIGINNIPSPLVGAANATQIYVRNVDDTASILVRWQAATLALPVDIITLNPGDQIMFWCNPDGPTDAGARALQLEPSADAFVEYFIGGSNL